MMCKTQRRCISITLLAVVSVMTMATCFPSHFPWLATVQGDTEGKKFASASYYLTITLCHGATETEPNAASIIPPLPEAIASFGGAVAGEYLYVYGGHTGKAHAHSRENLAKYFGRVKLTGGAWEELPVETPLQGFPLVAHDGLVYRVGGMTAHNALGDEDDLRSVDEFSSFDPATKKWTQLPPLPEPRSSHDAVVVGGTLYVVGGWKLAGSGAGDWHDTAWRIDLDNAANGWKQIATPPFRRRALAVSHVDDMLVVIGGIDDAGDVSRRVDGLDLKSGKWQRLADLPGEGMQGFGVSAWNIKGRICVSGSDGTIYGLSDSKTWKAIAQQSEGRFFHRLLPANGDALLVVAGSSMKQGHRSDCEVVSLE